MAEASRLTLRRTNRLVENSPLRLQYRSGTPLPLYWRDYLLDGSASAFEAQRLVYPTVGGWKPPLLGLRRFTFGAADV